MPGELLTITQNGPVKLVRFHLPEGLDSVEFDRVNERLAALFSGDAGSRWVLDLADVHYLGSSALGLLVNIRHQVKTAQGRLALCNLSPGLLKIFKTCCLERLFTISKSLDDAIRAVH